MRRDNLSIISNMQRCFLGLSNLCIMGQFTIPQRAFIVQTYIATRSYVEVQRLFGEVYPATILPSKMTIKRNFDKFILHGICWNLNEHNSGRPRTGRSPENIADVLNELEHHPRNTSCRRNNLALPSATFNRIARLDLQWHPYRLQRHPELLPDDTQRRVRFSQWFLERHQARQFLTNLVIGD